MAIENIFGAPPEYLSGLLGVDPDKLRKQALTTGLVNTALAFAAQPRNQNYGSVLPYAARALMAGQQGAQGVYQGALQDFQTKQKIEELKRQQEQQQAQQQYVNQFATERPELASAIKAYPQLIPDIVKQQIAPSETPFAKLNPKDYTQDSLKTYLQTRNPADLVPREETAQPSSVQEYNFARSQGFPGSFQNWKMTQKPEGVTVNVGQGGVAPKKIDEKFAEQFVDWTIGGGFSDVQKSLTQLEDAATALETSPEGTITGKVVGVTSPQILKFTNPQATATKEAVEEIVQRNLRLVLGAQFTEKEGDRLIARAYNPSLSQKENARRVRLLQQQIFDAAKAKQEAVDYYNENGTIFGWKGKMFNSASDFLKEYEQRIKPESKSAKQTQKQTAPQGVEQRIWDAMTPEERKLWQN